MNMEMLKKYFSHKDLVLVLLSIVGVISCFMTWIYYPKMDLSLRGINGDGILFATFFIILIALTLLAKGTFRNVATILNALLIAFFAVRKWYNFNNEINTFDTDELVMATSGVGVTLQVGFYLFLFASIGVLLKSIMNLVSKKLWFNLLGLLLFIASIAFILYEDGHIGSKPKSSALDFIETDFKDMNAALSKHDFNRFMDYIHPDQIIAMGGKKKLLGVLVESQQNINHEVKSIEILKSHVEGNTLQAALVANVQSNDNLQRQVYYAIKLPKSKTWKFISQVQNSFTETKNSVPSLSPELEFSTR